MGEPEQRLLLVEDDAPLRRSLVLTLADEGFSVLEAEDGRQGLAALSRRPDAVLLDLGLPDVDGVELCSRLRDRTGVPLLVLSARRAPADLAEALSAGADDYLTKPFPTAELARRLRSLLQPAPAGAWAVGDLRVTGTGLVTVGSRDVRLTSTELRVLSELAARPGHPVDRDVLAGRVWGFPPAAGRSALDARVQSLCRKLEPGGASVGRAGDGYLLHL